jgi:Tol biopolymer transport system component
MDGGEPVKIGEGMRWAVVSPDGKLIACSFETPGSPPKLAVVPIEGGSPIKVFDAQLVQPAKIRWTPDGRALTYVASRNGISDIWSQPIDGGAPKKLTDFKADHIFSFDWSRNNKLLISHGTSVSDVVLIRNVK